MMSASRFGEIVLLLVLAALSKKYIQLWEDYEELKVVCKTSCMESGAKKSENSNGMLVQNTRPHNDFASVFMDSSTGQSNFEKDGQSMLKEEFLDVNEPTLYNEEGRQDVTLTTPGLVLNNAASVVFQTSNVLGVKMEVEADTSHSEDTAATHMDSTDDLVLNPSESSFLQVQITQKSLQETTSLDENHIHGTSSQSSAESIHEINPMATETILKSVNNDNKAIDIGDSNAFHVNENSEDSGDKTDDNSTADDEQIPVSVRDASSDSTTEKRMFVLQTSLKEVVNEDDSDGAYNYFDTVESTLVLNTGLHGNPLHLMTAVSGYTQDGDVCDHEGCYEEFYDEEDEYEVINVEKFNSGKKHGLSTNREMSHDFVMTPNRAELLQFANYGTSAQCLGGSESSCQFQNLCFNTKEGDFVFFKGEKSVDDNIFDINLSTIHKHNAAMFSVVTLPASLIDKFSIGFVNKRSVAINRFKPDNTMHVLHDDILPLFQTLSNSNYPLFGSNFDAVIVFTDTYDRGDYIDLYSSLSVVDPVSLWQYNATYDLLCFPDIRVGLDTSTVWYQYGFFQPQGPISTWRNTDINKIRAAAEYLRPHFQSDNCFLCSQGNYLVFLSRKDNRLILNEGELIMSITKSTRLKVMSVSLETHSLSDIITTIRSSRGVIGMHGSLLSLAILFLPPGSIVIELFPFAVNPSHYTPFRTFCDLPGSLLVYKSWVNPSRTNSVPHPDRPATNGGIRHLPKQAQSEIVSQSKVPRHLCCDDPSWLYHIYQDTIVDVSGVVTLIMDAIRESDNIVRERSNKNKKDSEDLHYSSSSSKIFQQDLPGSVKNLHCDKVDRGKVGEVGINHLSFVVSWDVPWVFNYDDTAFRKYKYVLTIQERDDQDGNLRTVELPARDHVLYEFETEVSSDADIDCKLWVTVVGVESSSSSSSSSKGLAKFVRCS